MKKFILMLSTALLSVILCSCSGGGLFADPTPAPIPQVDPTQVISLQDAMDAIGNAYTLVQDSETADREGNKATIAYRADPTGAGDPVIVTVKQMTDTVSADVVWNEYDLERIKRSSAEILEGIGDDAYIAFPTIHVYSKGCEIAITAGSGSDDGQKDLLERLARKAVENLSVIMP